MEDVVGFRFRPTEEEMMTYYLERKLRGLDFPVHVINEVDMNTLEPWILPRYSAIQSDDQVWYFFAVPDYMDAKRSRINRKTPAGYWKVTGKDRPVKDKHGRKIGLKKTLVFHTGRSPNGVRTCWAMQEFHHKDATGYSPRPYVLCRLKWKSDDRDEPSTHLASNSGNQSDVNVASQENHGQPSELQPIVDNDELFNNSIPGVVMLPEERTSSSNVSINDLNASKSLMDASKWDEDFVNSLLVRDVDEDKQDEDFVNSLLVRDVDEDEQDDDFVNSLWASDVDEDEQDGYSINMLLETDADEHMNEDEQDEYLCATDVGEHIHEEIVQAHPHDYKPVKILHGYVEAVHPQKGELVETRSFFGGRSQDDGMLQAFSGMDGVGLHKKEETSLSRGKILKTVQTSGKAETPSLFRGRSQGNYMLRTRDVAEMTGGCVAQMGSGGLHKKEETSLSHEKILKKAEISGKASSKLPSDGSNGSIRKRSFIFQETSPSSHRQDPPSVYIVNIVVALILLVFFVREMASLH